MKRILILIAIIIGVVAIINVKDIRLTKMEDIDTRFVLSEEIENKILNDIIIKNDAVDLHRESDYYKNVTIQELDNYSKWKVKDVPSNYSEWMEIQKKLYNFYVSSEELSDIERNKWYKVDNYRYMKSDNSNGFFLFVDKGEWGAAGYFYPTNKEKYKILDDEHVVDFYEKDGEYYLITSFISSNTDKRGRVMKLSKRFNKWRTVAIEEFDDTPYCNVHTGNNTMYLVTNKELLRLKNNKIDAVIIKDAFWEGLYPSSIEFKDYIYIGMRGGVTRVDLNDLKMRFYEPEVE